MTTQSETDHWTAVKARIAYLEQEVQRHTASVTAYSDAGPADYAAIMRAGILLTDYRTELAELHALLTFHERHGAPEPKEIPAQLGILIIAVYLAIVLVILLYLVVLAGR